MAGGITGNTEGWSLPAGERGRGEQRVGTDVLATWDEVEGDSWRTRKGCVLKTPEKCLPTDGKPGPGIQSSPTTPGYKPRRGLRRGRESSLHSCKGPGFKPKAIWPQSPCPRSLCALPRPVRTGAGAAVTGSSLRPLGALGLQSVASQPPWSHVFLRFLEVTPFGLSLFICRMEPIKRSSSTLATERTPCWGQS